MELGHYGLVMEYVLYGALDEFMLTYYVWYTKSLAFVSFVYRQMTCWKGSSRSICENVTNN